MTTTSTLSIEQQLNDARNWAIELHGDQMYGDKPYVYHLDFVAGLAEKYGLSLEERLYSYLHDGYEDTGLLKAELVRRYGEDAHHYVDAVSGEGETREEQCASIVAKLTVFPRAINLKLMDRLANVTCSVADGNPRLVNKYRNEMPKYDHLFRQGHPEAYAELCRLLAL